MSSFPMPACAGARVPPLLMCDVEGGSGQIGSPRLLSASVHQARRCTKRLVGIQLPQAYEDMLEETENQPAFFFSQKRPSKTLFPEVIVPCRQLVLEL